MNTPMEALPASVRMREDRAARELALLEKLKPLPFANDAGDSGDDGDTLSGQPFERPQPLAANGDDGDRREPRARFELLEQRADDRLPGVYWHDVIRDREGSITGQAAPIWICSPLKVAAMTRDAQGGEWGRLLVFHDRDGREHRWTMPMRMLAGNGEELRASLLAEGLTLTTSGRHRTMLADYIQRERPEVTARCVKRTGWHGDVFVLLRETFGDTETEPVLFQAATLEGVTLGQAGTLDGWREHVASRCAGNSRLVLSICAGFAGPCLGLLGHEGGGFHLRGGSSTGKTTALAVAASLFGPPDYLRTWRHTAVALEGAAAMHSDLLLVLDEIGELEPKYAGQVAYMLANGQGRARGARDGSPRAVATWRILLLSSGEVALSDLVTESGGKVRAGQEVRVIDLPADAGAGLGLFEHVPDGIEPGAFADAIKTAAATHYGHALVAFLQELTAKPAKAREVLRAMRDRITSELSGEHAAGQVRRVAQRFALVAAAGELATVYRLTGWETGEAQRAALACFRSWLAARGTAGASEPAAMLDQVRAFLSAHGEARFTDWHADSRTPRTINRAGFRKNGNAGPTYYIECEAFRREVCAGFDTAAVVNALDGVGALEHGGDGRPTCKPLLPDGRRARVYIVTPALWGEP